MKKHLERFILCECCGRKVHDKGYYKLSPVYQKMIAECVCYDCAYWDMISKDNTRNLIMIEGVLYDLQPYCEPAPNIMLGMDGKECYILKADGSSVFSNDVWRIGTVPIKFQDRFSEGWWMTKKAFKLLQKRKVKCKRKECFDRYRCFFYDWQSELNKPSHHYVPKRWHLGDEMCKYYLDRSWIRNYDYDIRQLIQNSFKKH